MFERLLKLTIVDALDRVWSESGITPSKKTRQEIIRAAERISNSVQQDFIHEKKQQALNNQPWHVTPDVTHRKSTQPSPMAENDPVSVLV